MRHSCLHYPSAFSVSIKPIEESSHFRVQFFRGWCLEMNTFLAIAPETTSMGPPVPSRQAPTLMSLTPLPWS
jgi:hypothetical protein